MVGAILLPLVTIAIPTYNRADSYLPQALKCARDQTYSNLEIIVADNCSSDDTAAFIASIHDPRLRYFRHPVNVGSTNNLNFCLEQAKGRYVLFLHDDDRIDGDFVDSCIRAARGIADIAVIRTGMRRIDMHGNECGEVPNRVGGLPVEDFFLGWFNGRTPMHPCNTLFNAERLREIGGFNSKHNVFDDVMAVVKLVAKYPRVDVADIKASYRHHAQQLASKRQIASWCEDSLILLDTMCAAVSIARAGFLRNEGMKVFLRGNYRRARNISPLLSRLSAYGTILKYFNYPIVRFSYIVLSLGISRRTDLVKKRLKEALEHAPGLKARILSFHKGLPGSQQ